MRERGTQLTLPLLFLELELAAVPDDLIEPLLDDPAVAPYKHYVGTVRAVPRTRPVRGRRAPDGRTREYRRHAPSTACSTRLTSTATFTLNGEELSQAQVISRRCPPTARPAGPPSESFTEGLQTPQSHRHLHLQHADAGQERPGPPAPLRDAPAVPAPGERTGRSHRQPRRQHRRPELPARRPLLQDQARDSGPGHAHPLRPLRAAV